jgi:hypothetical protein
MTANSVFPWEYEGGKEHADGKHAGGQKKWDAGLL